MPVCVCVYVCTLLIFVRACALRAILFAYRAYTRDCCVYVCVCVCARASYTHTHTHTHTHVQQDTTVDMSTASKVAIFKVDPTQVSPNVFLVFTIEKFFQGVCCCLFVCVVYCVSLCVVYVLVVCHCVLFMFLLCVVVCCVCLSLFCLLFCCALFAAHVCVV